MTDCRYCGHPGAYDSGFSVECLNKTCSYYCETWASQNICRVVVKKRDNHSVTYANILKMEAYDAVIPYTQWVLTAVSTEDGTIIVRNSYSDGSYDIQRKSFLCKKDEEKVYRPSEEEILYGLDFELIPTGKVNVSVIVKENGSLNGYVLLTDVDKTTQLFLWNTQEQFDRYQAPHSVASFTTTGSLSFTTTGRLSSKFQNHSNKLKP